MEYTIQKLAQLAGVTTRTLRYYDQIGLLSPKRSTGNRYRIYGEQEVDKLQQILFYRELDVPLETIKQILHAPDYDPVSILSSHLQELKQRRTQLDLLIANVTKTIRKEKGDYLMTDKEKFEGLKKEMIKKNEEAYGEEIRGKYGQDTVERSNAKLMKLTEDQYQAMEQLGKTILNKLEQAVSENLSPKSEAGQEIAALHREWLSYTWPTYSPAAHKGLAEMYIADPRFTAYYDRSISGCAQFLHDAIHAAADY